jgi:energy-coupling factor transport system ATP-binding protein
VLIRVENLWHTYVPGTPLARAALHKVSLEIAPGERVGLVGRTGSGKSTLVQHVAGLLAPTEGQALLDGVPAHERSVAARAARLRVGLAFQYPEDQFFEQTVAREVAFGPRNLGLGKDEIASRVRWALEMVGLDTAMESRSPFTLSGGETRRVALASILTLRPEVLILDEPTAGMDPRGRRGLLARVRTWQEGTGSTLILVSHDLEELARVVERVIVLDQGRVAADGPARQVLSDAAALAAVGLDVPQPVALLRALRESGWKVRTDRLLPEEAVEEIARGRRALESPGDLGNVTRRAFKTHG